MWFEVTLLILGTPGTASMVRACAVVGHSEGSVTVAEEHALILWDDATKMEHFIRRAEFRTHDNDFGFLVPTPNKPELAAVDSQVFSQLENAVKPETIHRSDVKFHWGVIPWVVDSLHANTSIFSNVDSSIPVGSASGVEVLAQQTVAGYDAAILRANDPKALEDWLTANGYRAPNSLNDWVKPYIANGWVITAFKFSSVARSNSIETQSLRMTFETDRPFYPYREPPGQGNSASSHRLLRVYYVGDARFSGELQGGTTWPATTKYSSKRTDLAKVLSNLTGVTPPTEGWLTSFEDATTIRPSSELFFKPSADKSPVIPPPIVLSSGTINIPLCLDLMVLIVIVRLTRIRKSAKGPRTPAVVISHESSV